MSFTSNVKKEAIIKKYDLVSSLALLSAILRTGERKTNSIKIQTEHAFLTRYIYSLIKENLKVTPEIIARQNKTFSKKIIYFLRIKNKTNEITRDLSLESEVPKEFLIADEYQKRAYLAGLFLILGSINDPKKSRYHLEFVVDTEEYAKFIQKLLNYFNLNAKVIKKEKRHMIYIKEAEKIGDFLRIISTPQSLFYFEDIRIYRDHKNMINRINNCEQANIEKQISTAQQHLKDIIVIEQHNLEGTLDDKIKEAILYRKKYQDSSLQELSEIITYETGKSITKSGLYHRFQKIKKLVKILEEK